MALTDKLTAIAEAIREKGSTSEKLTLEAMVAAINALEVGGGSGGEEDIQLHWEGNLDKWNENGNFDWYFNKYANRITTDKITSLEYAFNKATDVEALPFDFNGHTGTLDIYGDYAFAVCPKLKEIGKIKNCNFLSMKFMFNGCTELRELPVFENCRYIPKSSMNRFHNMFDGCFSLRTIPEELLNMLDNEYLTGNYIKSMFSGCYTLDEIKGISPITGIITSNNFSQTFAGCYRVKEITFKTSSENGNVFKVKWQAQTIDLHDAVGWLTLWESSIIGHNSGITADKRVYDTASYEALKNDPDWYSTDVDYSRFNHDSAVNLINTLPDTSDYLAEVGGTTNSLILRNEAGLYTDGGKIGNLTEEEIAVATAKGWTITYKTL